MRLKVIELFHIRTYKYSAKRASFSSRLTMWSQNLIAPIINFTIDSTSLAVYYYAYQKSHLPCAVPPRSIIICIILEHVIVFRVGVNKDRELSVLI